ncbi:MAG TPA: hypothetical protein VKA46_22660 [Gemmataceae bacterium]|nr:hypothetical protein [Gemmataceae bacterium]
MKRFLNWPRSARLTNAAAAHRPPSVRPQLEQLDDRLVPSTSPLSSAISIDHSVYWRGLNLSYTDRDWYTVDQSTGRVVEFLGTTRHNLGGPRGVFAVSASVDPATGNGEVFALAGSGVLWKCDSRGHWSDGDPESSFPGYYKGISATRDGGVYAVTVDGQDVVHVDSQWNYTFLGAPKGRYGDYASASIAASAAGGNEVFVIGPDGGVYVNSANASGQWRLVDNSHSFVQLSATPDDTVFALSNAGQVYQETEHVGTVHLPWGTFSFDYWTGANVSGTRHWLSITADRDASGHDEVYAIEYATGNAYLYDQGAWAYKDSSVSDISGADGGYFYDVNYNYYVANSFHAWQFSPQGSSPWASLGYGLQ